jgi:glyoxylase-like metal-dependent hydrolase (beta-lactamase superfamily II)
MILSRDVGLEVLAGGHCTHPDKMVHRDGSLRSCKFPALFARIEHPTRGTILFDTGYARPFLDEVGRWPGVVYGRITPVHLRDDESAAAQLAQRGVAPPDVGLVVISHLHGDHIAGLRDFPSARFSYLPEAYQAVAGRGGLRALRKGFLPGLLPEDFVARSVGVGRRVALPTALRPFTEGFDLLGDGSVVGVALPGHARGQLGLVVRSGGRLHFLCADAAWSTRAIEERVLPSPLTWLIMADRRAYVRTLHDLHALVGRPDLRLVPSHCPRIWADPPRCGALGAA